MAKGTTSHDVGTGAAARAAHSFVSAPVISCTPPCWVFRVENRSMLMSNRTMIAWFTRPILHVTDVAASLRFYVDRLGFTSPWRHEEDGRLLVAQVDRQGCALILSSQWPDKVGKGLILISLDVDASTYEAEVAALDALRVELEANGVRVKDGSWGYRLLVVDDPDGNQLYFNYPNEP